MDLHNIIEDPIILKEHRKNGIDRSSSFKIKVKSQSGLPGIQNSISFNQFDVPQHPHTKQHSIEIHNIPNNKHNIQRRHTQRQSGVSNRNPIVSARRIKSVRYSSRPVMKNKKVEPSPVLVTEQRRLNRADSLRIATSNLPREMLPASSTNKISKAHSFIVKSNNDNQMYNTLPRNIHNNKQIVRTNTISYMPDKLNRINESHSERSRKKKYSRVLRRDSYTSQNQRQQSQRSKTDLKFYDVNQKVFTYPSSQESSPELSRTDSKLPILPMETNSGSSSSGTSDTSGSELDASSVKALSRCKHNSGNNRPAITTIAANPLNNKKHQIYRNLTFNGKSNDTKFLPREKRQHAKSVRITGIHNPYGDSSTLEESLSPSKINYFSFFDNEKKTGNVGQVFPDTLVETRGNTDTSMKTDEKATTLNTQDITNIINKFATDQSSNKKENLKKLKMTEKQLEKKLEDLEDEPLTRIQRVKYIILMLIVFVFISLAVFGAIVYLKRVFDNRKMATDVQDSNFIDFFNTDKTADFH